MNEQIIQLAKQGLKRSEIAKRLSVPKMVVLAVLCKAPSYHKLTAEDCEISDQLEVEQKQERKYQLERYAEMRRIALDLYRAGSKHAVIADWFNKNGYVGFNDQKFSRRQVSQMLRHYKEGRLYEGYS